MVGHTAGEGLYVLRTEKGGGTNWIYLDLASVFSPNTKDFADKIWGFDMPSGRLFVHRDGKLHVLYF